MSTKCLNLTFLPQALAADDIRIKGTRVGIETVLYEYIHNSQTPESIADNYYTLTLEQVYATILYYLQNREKIGAYLEDYLEYCRIAREEYEKNPPPGVVRLRQLMNKNASVSDRRKYLWGLPHAIASPER